MCYVLTWMVRYLRKGFQDVNRHFRRPLNSPLAHGVIDLIALAAADGDRVEKLEGT